ncbi:MAG: hypothetical protein PGN13_14465 [Patulibacter minatonensis]
MIAAGEDRAEDREQHRGQQHRPQRRQLDREAALEQDEREAGHADGLRHLVVVEVDPAEAVGADEHADREKGDEAGDAQSTGEQ